eukprot:CAMPEP_0201601624 /NCGR_PEP_ID=MMETSP0492-20130828/2557_1 /ASSEMBLY_ACC=CAM_ASM_000837 /TAXON_ID=420259 /ORGANISM="Thalassiosira gravida, Strain GMp14c1" /LENGTH=261 /DNA_ID=CAMNT_0048064911 /DNA_START=93 /DNA_END=878 /DNA_ORIENTATION=-
MTGSNDNEMSSTEKWYWALISSMIAVVLIHIFPYPRFVWSYTKYRGRFNQQAGERTPIFARVICSFFLLVFPLTFFGLFTYGFPLGLLGNAQYCPGDAGSTNTRDCKSAEDAGEGPFVFVFLPTFLMWIFDTIAIIGLLKQRDPNSSDSGDNTRCSVSSGQIPRVMFPRFGLTLVYCGLICFAGSLRTRIELEQSVSSEDIDTDAKLSFMEHQKTAGIVSFALAAVVWSVPIVIFSQRVCTQKRCRDGAAENEEHDINIQI